MTNQLIHIPDWNNNELKYILEVIPYFNGVKKNDFKRNRPIFFAFGLLKKDKRMSRRSKFELNKLYSEYIYQNSYHSHVMRKGKYVYEEVVIFDPLRSLKKIMQKEKKLLFNKFIEIREDKIQPKIIPEYLDEGFFKVEYYRIREEIISYLEHTIGNKYKEEIEELKQLFSTKNILSYEEFLNKRSKMLIELDLNDYISNLNKETELKKIEKNILCEASQND